MKFREETSMKYLIALALMVSATPVRAEGMDSANYMLPHCRTFLSNNPNGGWREGECLGTLEGILFNNHLICSPDGATYRQAVRVVVAYIQARPAMMHKPFMPLADEARIAAWPCK
jgi:hypothetical protein